MGFDLSVSALLYIIAGTKDPLSSGPFLLTSNKNEAAKILYQNIY
jgi:hypothetical protein